MNNSERFYNPESAYEDVYTGTPFGHEINQPNQSQPESQPKKEWRDGFMDWLDDQKQNAFDKANDSGYYDKRNKGLEQERDRIKNTGQKAIQAHEAIETPRDEDETTGEGIENQEQGIGENESIAALEREIAEIDERLAKLSERLGKIEQEIAKIREMLEKNPAPVALPTDELIDTPDETVGETERTHEDDARRVANKVRKSSRFANFFQKHKKKIVGALATLIAAGGIFAGIVGANFDKNNRDISEDINSGKTNIQQEQVIDTSEIRAESEYGIKDGYTQPGLWASEHKTGPYAFADAKEVSKQFNNDECEMIKYVADNQVESFADYLANLPEALQPEGFEGLSILETEAKLESLTPDEYEAVQKQFNDIMDKAYTSREVINGQYDNAYMRLKDPNGPLTHENMEIVKCTTDENNLEVTKFEWKDGDGNIIGSMLIKMTPIYDQDGNITGYDLCMQAINAKDSKPVVYKMITTIPNNPDQPNEPYVPADTPETPSDNTEVQPEEPSNNPEVQPDQESDAKNAEAIERNMQTGTETSNRVEPRGSGELTERPDTSYDSYQAEQNQQENAVTEARNQTSESSTANTVGEVIDNADTTYAENVTETVEQQAQRQQQAQAQAAQEQANQAAEQARAQAEANSQMSDQEAADWFGRTIQGQ